VDSHSFPREQCTPLLADRSAELSAISAIVRRVTAVFAPETQEGMFAKGERLNDAGWYVNAVHLLWKAVQPQRARARTRFSPTFSSKENRVFPWTTAELLKWPLREKVWAACSAMALLHFASSEALVLTRDGARGFRLGIESAAAAVTVNTWLASAITLGLALM
jgi:hypothetical protein